MCSRGSAAWWVRFVSGLGAVAVRRHAVMDRREVGLVVRATLERWDDVVYGVSAWLPAGVTDTGVAPEHTHTQSLPVRRQRRAAVSHASIVALGQDEALRQVVSERGAESERYCDTTRRRAASIHETSGRPRSPCEVA